MGFDSHIIVVPKISGTISAKTSLALYEYADFKVRLEREWEKKQIANGYEFKFDEYNRGMKEALPSSDEVLDLYKVYAEKYHQYFLHEGANVSEDESPVLESWGWCGEYFHDDILHATEGVFNNDYYDYRLLTKESIIKLLKIFKEKYRPELSLEPITATRCFKYVKKSEDDESEYDEDKEILSIPFDGLEVQFEDGSFKRLYTEDDDIFVIKDGSELGKYYALEKFISALTTAKYITDNNYIFYCGGR